VYAQIIPTIRNNILTARFMDCSPSGSPGSGDPDLAGIIQGRVKYFAQIWYNRNDSCVQFTKNELPSRLLHFCCLRWIVRARLKRFRSAHLLQIPKQSVQNLDNSRFNAPNFWGARE
jgi:hypothetical protein